MTNGHSEGHTMHDIDVAIIGGGPAGLQAALVLARTRKHVVVFDSPTAPRNGASHGVHNFVGLDGLLPQEIRDQAWRQIDVYQTARLERQSVVSVSRVDGSADFAVATATGIWRARHVILTCGYHDRLPKIDGFEQCWADTIIPCPFCDGFENKDRRWGIVASMARELDVFPSMVQHWTDDRIVIAPRHLDISDDQRQALGDLGVALHIGDIVSLDHRAGKLSSVTLDSGEKIDVETLLFTPDEEPAPLVRDLVDSLGLQLDEHGYVRVDESQKTNIDGLWAAGDVQGWMGGIESANAGGMAASMIVAEWFADPAALRASSDLFS